MRKIQLFNVAPSIPVNIRFLEDLAHNLWWSWNTDAIELFRRINPSLWRQTGHNPLKYLSRIPQDHLETLAKDEAFLQHMERVRDSFEAHMSRKEVPEGRRPCNAQRPIAYFSLEFGIHESVRLYSGGLGVLAGDHLKSAADMNIPLVAVGLLYRRGYFRQYLDRDGWQQSSYQPNEIHKLPVRRACDASGQPVVVRLPMPNGHMQAAVWRLDVGRVPLFLLDTNLPANSEEFRRVTNQLYDADVTVRVRQELLLAVGGFQALVALGYDPVGCHLNEGHAAFVPLARIPYVMQTHGLSREAAEELVIRTTIFTTHTPVPAGNETFHVDVLRPHLDALRDNFGLPSDQIIRWGQWTHGHGHELSMTVMGLRMSQYRNGVSKLHGHVARQMWNQLWPGYSTDEVPITSITNGIHAPSFISLDLANLYDRYLGSSWRVRPAEPSVTARIEHIPDEELWRAHELSRSRLVRTARDHAERQYRARNATRAEIASIKSILDHDTLTIGFARRFATYKRGTLLLRDRPRLEAMLTNEDRPVQFLFAGKAHPNDDHGKALIKELVHFAQQANVRHRIVFLENYDIRLARHLVQGVDVWLNTPRRPQEASGTSGMKAAVNGALNVSILDGWWCEGSTPDTGWAIGSGEEYADYDYQDTVESQALYNVLENEVVPCFYDRPAGDLPREWIRMMKHSIRMAMQKFTSHRMAGEYDERFYAPVQAACETLCADGGTRAVELVRQHTRFSQLWSKVFVYTPTTTQNMELLHVGDTFEVTASIQLGDLAPDEVGVQVYYGIVDSENRIQQSQVGVMALDESPGNGLHRYRHRISCDQAGRYGFTVRVVPHGRDWDNVVPGFVTWADE